MPDVFGLNRRTVESPRPRHEAARYQMLAAYTTLINNVVVTAIQEASIQAQIDATRRLIDSQQRSLQILEYQRTKAMPAASISPRRKRSSPRPRPPCRR